MQTLEHIRKNLKIYPMEVVIPNIHRWKTGNTGIDYVHSFVSSAPGPHVMIMALIHGNEVSGAIVVDQLLKSGLRPLQGRITLAFANVDAYEQFDKNNPDASRFIDEDMNRVWSEAKLDGPADSCELRRARALRPIIDSVDLLLDMHSMHEEAAPLMMSGPLEKGVRFAAKIGVPQYVISDIGHPNGKRLRDYGGFGDPDSAKNALLLEAGQHFSLESKNVALDVAARFLVSNGAVAELDMIRYLKRMGSNASQCFLHVTQPIVANTMNFEFTQDFRGLEMIENAGTVIAHDGDKEITTAYDQCFVIQPSLRHLGPGVTVMRQARRFQL
jgi:predicted deacylase